MPEIAEVARIVHFIKKTIVGKTLAVVRAQDDANVFGKVGTTAAEFQKALSGKKVLDAGSQGKYFWLVMSSPPHPVMHFGMTGWFNIKGLHTGKYAIKNTDDTEEWPPRFWKFLLETKESPKVEAAFVDSRRFARIRLLDCDGTAIRQTTPLKENGPDPVVDRDLFTLEWFEKKMLSKKVPVKALMLDQANISGIGNWVGDEILYHAKLHPEQYSNTFTHDQLKQLHTSILHICQTAVDLLADASKFPDDWLFRHRWGKGKKDAATTLPNGAKITFLTVGGRTSCIAPSIQKKTGPVAADIKDEDADEHEDEADAKHLAKKKTKSKPKKKADSEVKEEEEAEVSEMDQKKESALKPKKRKATTTTPDAKPESQSKSKSRNKPSAEDESTPVTKKAKLKNEEEEKNIIEIPKTNENVKSNSKTSASKTNEPHEAIPGRRRSGRLSAD